MQVVLSDFTCQNTAWRCRRDAEAQRRWTWGREPARDLCGEASGGGAPGTSGVILGKLTSHGGSVIVKLDDFNGKNVRLKLPRRPKKARRPVARCIGLL